MTVILWFFPEQERPLEIYAFLSAIVLICEILPIPLVVNQYRKSITAKTIAGQKWFNTLPVKLDKNIAKVW